MADRAPITAAVVTVSDSCARGERQDRSGPAVAQLLEKLQFSVGVKKTPYAVLSRGVCGVRGKALILNVPGSPTGAVESLEAVATLIPHAVDLLSGKTQHN
jgi:molybdopterin biosynthesis enzyme MoaB